MQVYKLKDRYEQSYLFNWDNVHQVCWAWEKNAGLANYLVTEQKTSGGSIYFLNPNTRWIFNRYNNNFTSQTKIVENLFKNEGGEHAINKLVALRNQTKRFQSIYFDKLKHINKQNAHSLRKMNNWVVGAKFLRNTGATVVCIGSSVITMPATVAAGLLATGSAVKSYAKFTDTGKVGAAGVEFVCEMGVGLLGVGGQTLSKAQQVCVILFAKMPAEAAKCAASGDSLKETAVATLVTGAMSFASDDIHKLLKKIVIPSFFKEKFNPTTLKESAELAHNFIENKIEDALKDDAKSYISGKGTNKKIKFDALKSAHINQVPSSSHHEFIRKYCITKV